MSQSFVLVHADLWVLLSPQPQTGLLFITTWMMEVFTTSSLTPSFGSIHT